MSLRYRHVGSASLVLPVANGLTLSNVERVPQRATAWASAAFWTAAVITGVMLTNAA